MSLSTPTLDNQKLFAEILSEFPKDLGKDLFQNLIEGEEVEWKYTFKPLGGKGREITGQQRAFTPRKTAQDALKSKVKNFFLNANYSNAIGEELNSVVKCVAFVDKWYDFLKTARAVATLTTGPVGLVFGLISVYETTSTAWKDLSQWYDQLGFEEHKRQGAHLQKLKQFHDSLVKNIYGSCEASWNLVTAHEMQNEVDNLRVQMTRFTPARGNNRIKAYMQQVVSHQQTRIDRILNDYATQLRAFMGLLCQAEMLRMTLDRIHIDCDENPLRYWGCSFAEGYKNPGVHSFSFDMLKVNSYTVISPIDSEKKKDVEKVMAASKANVKEAAIGMANLIDLKHLPLLRARASQMTDEMARIMTLKDKV